jgi:hypothetical protein
MKRTGFADFLNDPATGWTRVIVTQGIGLAINLIATLIAVASGDWRWLSLWVLSMIALVLGLYMIRRQSEPLILVPENEQPMKQRGLIILVGTGRPGEDPMKQSAGIAITYHSALPGEGAGLKTCWLVASGGEGGALPVAQTLKKQCESRQVTAFIHETDAFDVQATYEVVQKIYADEVPRAGLAEQEVIADITGGTKPMTVGMALACGDRRSMQYMYGRKEGIASIPRLIRFAPRRRRG